MDDNLTTNFLDEKHKTSKVANINQVIAKNCGLHEWALESKILVSIKWGHRIAYDLTLGKLVWSLIFISMMRLHIVSIKLLFPPYDLNLWWAKNPLCHVA